MPARNERGSAKRLLRIATKRRSLPQFWSTTSPAHSSSPGDRRLPQCVRKSCHYGRHCCCSLLLIPTREPPSPLFCDEPFARPSSHRSGLATQPGAVCQLFSPRAVFALSGKRKRSRLGVPASACASRRVPLRVHHRVSRRAHGRQEFSAV